MQVFVVSAMELCLRIFTERPLVGCSNWAISASMNWHDMLISFNVPVSSKVNPEKMVGFRSRS